MQITVEHKPEPLSTKAIEIITFNCIKNMTPKQPNKDNDTYDPDEYY